MSTQVSSDDFTAAEAAYFSSKGADTAALEAEISQEGQGEPQGSDLPRSGTEGAPEQNAQKTASDGLDDGDGEEVVVLGKDGKPRAQNGRFVPHQALHKERERRKGVETELQTVRERQARADERLAVLNEILSKADEPAQPRQVAPARDTAPPDAATDPLGALAHALNKITSLEQTIQESTKRQTEADKVANERTSETALRNAYQNDAIRYVKETPEFADAYRYLIEGRHREFEAMGVTDQNERNKLIAREERDLVAQSIGSKRSPAQMLHNLAVARGFKAAAPKTDPAQKIESIARGQRAAGASLSGSGGTSGEGLTASSLADMDEEQFAATVAKLGKAGMRRLLGG